MQDFNHIDLWNLQLLGIDLAIIVLMIVALRFVKGLIANVDTHDEIASRNNSAFGMSFAGGITGLVLMMMGASSGNFQESAISEALYMLSFGVSGLVMITVGRLLQDKLVMKRINIHQEIVKGNSSAALLDIGNVVATGLVVAAAMRWVETEHYMAIPVVLLSFAISQIVLSLASIYQIRLYRIDSKDSTDCFQSQIGNENSALALRYAGFLIGVGLAINAATGVAPYEPENVIISTVLLGLTGLVSAIIFSIISLIVRKLVLPGVKIATEVEKERNVGVAAIEVAIFIAIGLSLMTLFAGQ